MTRKAMWVGFWAHEILLHQFFWRLPGVRSDWGHGICDWFDRWIWEGADG